MANKNIRFKDSTSSDILYPQTLAANVIDSTGTGNLGTVEAGAQVNVIETIKVNGVVQTPVNKTVDITVSGTGAVDSVNGAAGAVILKVNDQQGTTSGSTVSITLDADDVGAIAAPATGTTGQYLKKTASGVEWADAPSGSITYEEI